MYLTQANKLVSLAMISLVQRLTDFMGMSSA